jgi:hypothetical protein
MKDPAQQNDISVAGVRSESNTTAPVGITPELLDVLQAAATAFLGRKVFIISVNMHAQTTRESESWTSQGRDILQASHNIVQRGH